METVIKYENSANYLCKIDTSWIPLFMNYELDLDELYSNDSNLKVFPPIELIFEVFKQPIYDIKICILGQDPYHNEGEANGYAFSVPDGIKIPPSLRNICKEINIEFPERNYKYGGSGNLTNWVKQGVFLLNCSLSVEKNSPSSHIEIWEDFTNDVITKISIENPNAIFVLFGNFAKSKKKYIENKKSIILECVHPSPLSASKGFFGSNIFKRIEENLGYEFDWNI